MRRRTKISLAACSLVGTIVATWTGIALWHNQSIHSADEIARELTSLIAFDERDDFHARLDKVRVFVNDNSIHKIDEAFRATHASGSFPASVLNYATGVSAEPPHMECSTRSNLMAGMLRSLGYRTRIVVVFDTDTNLQSHTFIDVMNPTTELWESQDADYDIYWRRNGDRISVVDYSEEIDKIEPCGRSNCGWNHTSREGFKAKKLRNYIDIVSVTDKHAEKRFSRYTSRANLSRIYIKGSNRGTFCEIEAKRCDVGFDKALSHR